MIIAYIIIIRKGFKNLFLTFIFYDKRLGDRMFFFAVMGTSEKRENIGDVLFDCSHCNSKQVLSIFKDYNYFHIFFIPIFKFSVHYDGVCTKCKTEYYIDNETGKLLDKGLLTSIDSSSLKEKQCFKGYTPVCPVCNNKIDHDDVYCRKCGYKL